ESCMSRSSGHCMVMGTASTMASMAEALGMTLSGNAAIPAPDSRRLAQAELAGRRAVEMATVGGPRPSEILSARAFDNAIRTLMAVGGSTNAVIHLLALAGRAGVPLTLRRFDELSRGTPFLLNLRPSGKYLMEDFFYAGGLPVVLRELLPLLHGDAPTVNGKSLADNVRDARCWNDDVIRPLGVPLASEGGLAMLTGNLCPDGAVIKVSAASPHLLTHRGRAVVFEDHEDLHRRIDDPALVIDETSVLVLKHVGPRGAPGMPEWGAAPLPARHLQKGVKDMVRISDARMSGTSYGTVVLHVTPQSAVGGPLALVQDGNEIEPDVPPRTRTLTASARGAAGALSPRRASTLAARARPRAAAGRSRARAREAPPTSDTRRTARARSFAERGCMSTMRLPYTFPSRVMLAVVRVLSTSFVAVPALSRVEPASTSAPGPGAMTTMAPNARAVRPRSTAGLHATSTVPAPRRRASARAAAANGVTPLAETPTTTSPGLTRARTARRAARRSSRFMRPAISSAESRSSARLARFTRSVGSRS